MGAIRDAFETAARNYNIADVPASEPHNPEVSDFRAIGALIEARLHARRLIDFVDGPENPPGYGGHALSNLKVRNDESGVTFEPDTSNPPPLDGQDPHRYWKLVFTATNEPAGNLNFNEVELLESYAGGNLASYGTAYTNGSVVAGGQGPTKSNDGAFGLNTRSWDAASHTFAVGFFSGVYLKIDFGAGGEKAINICRIVGIENQYVAGDPRDFTLQYSDDDVSYTVSQIVGVASSSWDDYELREFIDPTYSTPSYTGSPWGAHVYWRIFLLEQAQRTNGWGCRQIEFRATPSGADQATGGTASAGTTYSGSYLPSYAFDGDDSTNWASTFWSSATALRTNWIAYHFASPVEVAQIRWTARGAEGGPTAERQSPATSIVQFSDDGYHWTSAWWIRDTSPWSTPGESRVYTDPLYV